MSAQVYNEVADFKTVAGVLKGICEKVNRGEWREKDGVEAGVVD